jgi:hypothetical protein
MAVSNRVAITSLLVLLVGCAQIEGKPSGAPSGPSVPSGAVSPSSTNATPGVDTAINAGSAPFVVRLHGPEGTPSIGSLLVLELRIERNVINSVPLDLTLRLPTGVRLSDGSGAERIADPATAVIVRRVVLAVDQVPSDDLAVTVEARASNWGTYAQAFYRFGRPEPRLPDLPHARPVAGPGGRSLGRPTPIGAPTTR